MAECEHEKMTTRFCPECGQVANVSSLSGLLKHLSKNIRKYELHMERWEGHSNPKGFAKAVRSTGQTLSKWRAWHAGLKAMLDSQDTHP